MSVIAKSYRRLKRELSSQRLEVRRLRRLPRYVPATSRLVGPELRFVDAASFCSAYESICEREIYAFPTRGDSPLIIDCGANVGVSVIWFSQHYPGARIIAFEPDPEIFKVLRDNISNCAHNKDIECIQAAVWHRAESELQFMPDGADAGRTVSIADERITTRVPAVALRDYLDESIDLLKLDIEGAEFIVLKDCSDRLCNVRNLFVEYHSFQHEPQRLDELLALIRQAGFRIQVQTEFCAPRPFLGLEERVGMDLQLNIFGIRTDQRL